MKRLYVWVPSVVSVLIAISAVGLFVHTASSREFAAQARRKAAQEAAAALSAPLRERDARTEIQGYSLRQPLSAAVRQSVMGKRLDSVRAVANSLDRTRALLALMREFEPGDFRLAMEECKAGPEPGGGGESKTILEQWSRSDPLAALAYAGEDAGMKMSILGIWAGTDPAAALNWARQDTSSGSGADLAGPVIAAIAETNPRLAMDHLSDLSPETRKETLKTILKAGDAGSAKAVIDWIGAIQDPAGREEMAKFAFDNWKGYGNILEQKFALFEAYPETLSGEDIGNLFDNWNPADPQAVQVAIDRMPQGNLRQEAINGVIGETVANSDLKGAVQLMGKYGKEVSDEVLRDAISGASNEDPETTLKQAALIGDAGIRDGAVAEVLNRWAEDAPEDARAWMDSHEVSPLAREKFDKLSKRGPFRTKTASRADILEALGR